MSAHSYAAPLSPRPARRRRSRLRLGCLMFLFLALAAELVVRVFGLVDVSAGAATPEQAQFNAAAMFVADGNSAISYRNRPGARATIAGIEYEHDRQGGFRVVPKWPIVPLGNGQLHGTVEPATVAFLGDSTCYGLGLRAEDTLPAQVQTALGGEIVAVNLGVCGYGTAQEAALYEAQRDALRDARLVVLLVFPNDFAPGTFLWDDGLRVMYVDPLPLPRVVKPLLWRSAAYRALVSWRGEAARQRGDFDAMRPGNEAACLAGVERLAAAVRAEGKTLLVAHLPAMERLDPYMFERQVAALRAQCERLGVAYVDLLEPFLAERERQSAEFEKKSGQKVSAELRAGFLSQFWIVDPSDHHLNAKANGIAARALGEAVRKALGG